VRSIEVAPLEADHTFCSAALLMLKRFEVRFAIKAKLGCTKPVAVF
jgi:hypothetical protein